MVARRKLKLFNLEERKDLRQQIELEDISRAQKNAMLKDCHLVEAAIVTDRRIVALDNTARELFSRASSNIPEIQDILWVNPISDSVRVIDWLNGASEQAEWRLCP